MVTRSRTSAAYATSAVKTRHTQAVLPMKDGAITLVLVADTHGNPHPDSDAHIEAQRPDYILHGGDVGDIGVIARLARIAPVTVVRGNIDARAADLPDFVTIDVMTGDATRLRILLTHIAVAGVRIRADVARLARAEAASLVACGHSHLPFIGRDRDLVVFNPGSIGPRRFGLPIVFGVLRIDERGIDMRHVDCETGKDWSP